MTLTGNKTARTTVLARLLALMVGAAAILLSTSSLTIASGHGSQDAHSAAEEPADESDSGGIDLGQYRIRSYYPVEAQKSTVTFALCIAPPSERYADMNQFVEIHEHKLRDQVITATRLAPLAEFDQPDLAAFRRRILTRLRRSLPELAIDDVYVSDFQLTVKSL